MLGMAWRTVRWHPGSVMGALITLVLASAVMSALWFVVDSTDRQPPVVERFAGTPLVVTTGGIPGAISPGLVAEVRALPQVAAAVPELSFVAPLAVRGRAVYGAEDQYRSPWGHGWSSARLTPFRIEQGRPPHKAGEVVVDATLAGESGIAVGDRVEVRVGGVPRPHEVVGVAGTPARWRHQSALFFADEHAERLAGRRGGADQLGVFPRRGIGEGELREAVAGVLRSYNQPGAEVVRVATGPGRGVAEGNASPGGASAGAFNTLWFLVATTAVVAVGMVAAALGVSVRRRSTEIAVLRAVGARPGQIRRMLLAEGLLLSLAAAAAGVPLGALLAPLVAGRLRDFGVVNVSFAVDHHPLAALGASLFTVAVALPASLVAVRRALRIRPGDALGEAPAEGRKLSRGRLVTGLALLGTALVLVPAQGLIGGGRLVALSADFSRLCLVVAGVGLVAPWFVPAVVAPLRPWADRAGGAGVFLPVANVLFHHRRFAGAAGALTLGVTLVGAVVATQSFYDWRRADDVARTLRADHVLIPDGGNNRLDEQLRRATGAVGIRMLPLTMTPQDGGPPLRLSGTLVTGDLARVLDLPVRGRPLDALGEREIAVTEETAARIGTPMRIRLPGTTEDEVYTVAATYPYTGELGQAVLPALPRSAAHLQTQPYGALYVRGPLDRETVEQAGGTAAAYDRQGYILHQAALSADNNRLLPYLSVLIAVFCLVAAVNGLCLALLDRRREFAGMWRLGMRRGQVMRMVCGENVLTVLPSLALALAAAAALASVQAVTAGAGLAVAASFVPFGWIALLGGCALPAALAGSLLVVRTSMRNER